MQVDLNRVITALVIASLIVVGGAIWDFQNVKANVSKQENKIDMIYDDLKEVKRDVKSLLRKE
tara:strand:- start:182 stop:370 length:189 start_codon:yes stop_codon:yes gene_type:complete